MKVKRELMKILAQSAYVTNLLDGGIAQPMMTLEKNDTEYLLSLRLAGTGPDDLSVEIDKDNLFIYHLIGIDEEMKIPYLLRSLVIPSGVNFEEITAEFQDGQLRVILPFDELTNGYHREVEINTPY